VFGRTGTVVATSGDYTFAKIGTTPTTLAGYGITDAASATHSHAASDVASGTLAIARIPTGSSSSTVCLGNDSRLSDARTPLTHSHVAADVTSGVFATSVLPHKALRTSANVALSASTTINLTALDITVASGDVWVLDYIIPVTVSGGTAGLKPIFTLPASSTGTMDVSGTVASVTGYSYTHSTTPTSAAAVAFMTASFTGYIYVRAQLTMGAAGTLRIGVTTGTSAAGNLLAGASVLAIKI